MKTQHPYGSVNTNFVLTLKWLLTHFERDTNSKRCAKG